MTLSRVNSQIHVSPRIKCWILLHSIESFQEFAELPPAGKCLAGVPQSAVRFGDVFVWAAKMSRKSTDELGLEGRGYNLVTNSQTDGADQRFSFSKDLFISPSTRNRQAALVWYTTIATEALHECHCNWRFKSIGHPIDYRWNKWTSLTTTDTPEYQSETFQKRAYNSYWFDFVRHDVAYEWLRVRSLSFSAYKSPNVRHHDQIILLATH